MPRFDSLGDSTSLGQDALRGHGDYQDAYNTRQILREVQWLCQCTHQLGLGDKLYVAILDDFMREVLPASDDNVLDAFQ